MNAVERLLAHVERFLSLFDEMYRVPDRESWGFAVFLEPSVEQIPPAFSKEPWASIYWWQAAVATAGAEVALTGGSIADRASTLLRERLGERQCLANRDTWQQMVADVVRTCRAWDFLAKKVVNQAQEVADRVLFILDGEENWYGDLAREWQSHRQWLLRDLGLLRRYAQPPAAADSTSAKQPSGGRRGGRTQNDEALARDLLDGWRAYEPEEGRKTKDRYLAQRPDVRVLKTEDARQRKIATMRVALDSALHLRREKTKQKKRLRG
jgi:hypothetical protein